ncbi:MAG TPA: M28 family peptidase [Terriglobia bacterium]|nr:M28 family peptidase [Terriglobia bacterium]
MSILAFSGACVFLAGLAAGLQPALRADSSAATRPPFSSAEFLAPIKYLASPALKGRGNGSPELNEAADYIAGHFRSDALTPAGDEGSYLQHFQVTVGAKLGPVNSLNVESGGSSRPLVLSQDYIPLSFSEDGRFSAAVVFAGYGITDSEHHYDDYQGLDTKGKFVLVLRHEPQESKPQIWLTTRANPVDKAINARNHGAVGVILVNDTANHPGDPDTLITFGQLAGPEELKIAALQITASTANEWLKASGHTLDELSGAIDRDLSNHSLALDPTLKLTLAVDVERIRKTESNVIALLPGSDPGLASQCLVIGAHYDHLGLGDQHSLAPSQIGQVHPGADDNASGTSAVLALADYFAHGKSRPRHSIIFVNFAGEELGLLGSSYYTEHPPSACPLSQTAAMINMDMVGRIAGNRLYVGGTGTSPGFQKLVDGANQSDPAARFAISYEASGYGSSDHSSFTVKGVPVLFFFSGLHSDYHKPSDTWDKINAADGARVAELVADTASALDELNQKPEYVRVAPPPSAAMGGGSGYGPYFGSIPDFGHVEHDGVKFGDVHDGSPAAKAGFKAGDILIDFGGTKIDNLYDFTYALRAHKPGDKVMVTVLRNGEKVTREVTLEVRK